MAFDIHRERGCYQNHRIYEERHHALIDARGLRFTFFESRFS